MTQPIISAGRLVLAAALALAVAAGFNAIVGWQAANLPPQQLLRRLDAAAPNVDTLFLGNSVVEAGVDRDVFMAAAAPAGAIAFNAGLGATSPAEHCLLLAHALPRAPRLRRVIYGFFDDALTAPVTGRWSELVGNRALSYRFPELAADLYAPGDWLTRTRLRATAAVPLLAERLSIWVKVERLKRAAQEIGLPAARAGRFGRAGDFAALERFGAIAGAEGPFNRPVQEMLRRTAAARGDARVVFVEMPVPSAHRRRLYETAGWGCYRTALRDLAGAAGADYLVASDWVEDTGFEDPLHLNAAGAARFSARLGHELAEVRSPRTEADR